MAEQDDNTGQTSHSTPTARLLLIAAAYKAASIPIQKYMRSLPADEWNHFSQAASHLFHEAGLPFDPTILKYQAMGMTSAAVLAALPVAEKIVGREAMESHPAGRWAKQHYRLANTTTVMIVGAAIEAHQAVTRNASFDTRDMLAYLTGALVLFTTDEALHKFKDTRESAHALKEKLVEAMKTTDMYNNIVNDVDFDAFWQKYENSLPGKDLTDMKLQFDQTASDASLWLGSVIKSGKNSPKAIMDLQKKYENPEQKILF